MFSSPLEFIICRNEQLHFLLCDVFLISVVNLFQGSRNGGTIKIKLKFIRK